MTTSVRPVSEKVRKEMRRRTSRWRLVRPALAFFLRFSLFLLVAGGGLFGIYSLWDRALADPRFLLAGETLALAGAVRECPESVAELEAVGRRFGGRSLLDPLLISDMEQAYGESVWVKQVTRMRRRFPNRMEVEFLLRLPAAQVWQDGRFWLVDSDAALLPVEGSRRAFPSLPEIVGVTANIVGGRPKPGEAWRDEGVTGGLGILRAFWGSPLADAVPVSRVVVNAGVYRASDGRDREIRRRFEVVTTGGAVVRWGTFNAGDLPGELTSAEKLWSLQELLRTREALKPGVSFDVRTRLPGFSLVE